MSNHFIRPVVVIMAMLSAVGLAGPARAADADAGKRFFTQQCGICHAVQAGRTLLGPHLFGVVGRKSGAVAGFRYSPANQNANLTWDEETLDKYLRAPTAVVPGTTMAYAGVKDDTQRANLIAYLATLK